MAAREVIYFRLWEQLPAHPVFPARLLPEPVAEPPPQPTNAILVYCWSHLRPSGRPSDHSVSSASAPTYYRRIELQIGALFR